MNVSSHSIARFLNFGLYIIRNNKFCPIGICDESAGLVAVINGEKMSNCPSLHGLSCLPRTSSKKSNKKIKGQLIYMECFTQMVANSDLFTLEVAHV